MAKLKRSDCWIVIPAFNEENHIGDVVKRVRKQKFENIVVVDDGSTDKTFQIAKKSKAHVLKHVVNLHKGASMTTGSEYALKNKAKAIIYMDADGQHCPEELDNFLDALNDGYEVAFGFRKESKKMPFQRRMGKHMTSATASFLFGLEVHDVLNGYRALTSKAYKTIRWNSRGYDVEAEMISRAGKNSLKYTEVQTKIIYHSKYKGMTPIHGARILWKLFWWKITL